MWIKELHIKNFGKFIDKKIELSPGMNLIYGENESGKSTLHTFIRGCLYGIRKMRGRASKKDDFSHYQPWENSNYYAGNLRFVCGNKIFRLERDFMNPISGGRLVCETDGELLSLENGDLDMLLGDVGEVAFLNTVCIGQLKNETDEGLIGELQNYIANFQESGNYTIDIEQALLRLKNQKKELEKKSFREQEKQEAKVRQLFDYMGYLNAEIASDQEKLQDVQGRIVLTKRQMDEMQRSGKMDEECSEKESNERAGQEWKKDFLNEELSDEDELLQKKGFLEKLGVSKSLLKIEAALIIAILFFSFLMHDFKMVKEFIVMMALIAVVVVGIAWVINNWTKKGPQMDDQKEDDPEQEEGISQKEEDSSGSSLSAKDMNLAMEKLYWQMEHLSSEIKEKETLVENCQQDIQMYTEESTGEKFRLHKENKAALELAANRMQEVIGQMQGTIGVHLKKRTSEIFSEITNGYYTQVQMEDNLCTGVHMKDRYVPLEQLSRGTIWQVYFAYRMAAGEILAQEEPLPIMLDDAFVMYDEGRLAQVLAWLAKQEKQILLFTCQKREKELLEQLGVVYHEVVL